MGTIGNASYNQRSDLLIGRGVPIDVGCLGESCPEFSETIRF